MTINKKATIAFALMLCLTLSASAFAQDAWTDARNAFAKKDYQSAIRHGKLVVEEHPEWVWGHYILALSYAQVGNHQAAINSANKALDYAEDNNQSFAMRFVKAQEYYKLEDYENTIEVIKKIEQRHTSAKEYASKRDSINKMAGYAYALLGNHAESVKAFKPLIDSGKASADVLRAAAKSYQDMGQDSKAIELISQVVRKDPKDLKAHRILVKSYLNAQDYRKVVDAAQTAIQSFDRDWELYYFLGAAQYQLKQLDSAESSLQRSLAIRAQDKTRKLLGDVLMNRGRYADAAKQFGAAQTSFADDPNLYYNIAFCWTQFVPKNAEEYHGKPQEGDYMQALKNAEDAINRAGELGLQQDSVTGIKEVISNKRERLEKGAVVKEVYEYTLDPETGKPIRRKVEGNEDK